MKRIINGKMYNTETATLVGKYWNGLSTSDFRYVDEYLYKKKNGEFFLHGEGGGLSPYAQRHADGSSGGSKILPLTLAEAKEWGESNFDTETYESHFGTVGE